MKKLIVWNLVTLDGFFEGANPWDLGWHKSVWGEELEQLSIAQLKTAGSLVFGRNTYAGMASYWSNEKGEKENGEVADLMNRIPKIVFSRSLSKADWNNTRLVREDAAAELARLKREPGLDYFIFGSANLISSLLPAGQIDELRLGLVPVILGAGNPLFKADSRRSEWKLLEARPLKSGCVILRYEPARPA